MDSLIDRESRSISNFYQNIILPLCFYGVGTAESLMNMKIFELKALKRSLDDHDMKALFFNTRGLEIE